MCLVAVCVVVGLFYFFKQKTAYEMRSSDGSSDVCSSDLLDQIGGAMDMVLRKGYYGTSHDRSPCDRFRSGSGWKRQLPLGPISCYHEPMAKATGDNTKRKRPAQTGQLIGVRLQIGRAHV